MRLGVRVKPGSSRDKVGGTYPAPHGDELIVAVSARAVEGQANAAVTRQLAKALGCRGRDIVLTSGATARSKVFEVPDDCAARLTELLAD